MAIKESGDRADIEVLWGPKMRARILIDSAAIISTERAQEKQKSSCR